MDICDRVRAAFSTPQPSKTRETGLGFILDVANGLLWSKSPVHDRGADLLQGRGSNSPRRRDESCDGFVSFPRPSFSLLGSLRIEQEVKPNPALSSGEDLVLGSQLVVSSDDTLVREEQYGSMSGCMHNR